MVWFYCSTSVSPMWEIHVYVRDSKNIQGISHKSKVSYNLAERHVIQMRDKNRMIILVSS